MGGKNIWHYIIIMIIYLHNQGGSTKGLDAEKSPVNKKDVYSSASVTGLKSLG